MLTITLLSALGLLLMFVGFAGNIGLNRSVAIIGLVACLGTYLFGKQDILSFAGIDPLLSFDSVAVKFGALCIGFTVFVAFLADGFIRKEFVQSAEFLAVMIFSLVGAVMLTSFTHMLTLFVGLETLGISLYVLAGTDKKSPASNEAALKYLLLGAFATGITLFGMALLYGATGSLDFATISSLAPLSVDSALFKFGVFFLAIGILFKVSAVPFHFWSPDVYEGSPNVVMLYMSVVVKIASFAALYRIFGLYFSNLSFFWWDVVYYACIASLVVGNTLALMQKSIKRQMAFSSIAHTGYLLLALLVAQSEAVLNGLVFYLFVYGAAVLAAFAVLMNWFGTAPDMLLDQLKGAMKQDKAGAIVLTLAFLSMSAVPLTGGFFSKVFMFAPAMHSGLYQVLIVAILASVVGAAFYARPIINMWFSGEEAVLEKGNTFQWIAFVAGALLLLTGLFPDAVGHWIAAI